MTMQQVVAMLALRRAAWSPCCAAVMRLGATRQQVDAEDEESMQAGDAQQPAKRKKRKQKSKDMKKWMKK